MKHVKYAFGFCLIFLSLNFPFIAFADSCAPMIRAGLAIVQAHGFDRDIQPDMQEPGRHFDAIDGRAFEYLNRGPNANLPLISVECDAFYQDAAGHPAQLTVVLARDCNDDNTLHFRGWGTLIKGAGQWVQGVVLPNGDSRWNCEGNLDTLGANCAWVVNPEQPEPRKPVAAPFVLGVGIIEGVPEPAPQNRDIQSCGNAIHGFGKLLDGPEF